MSPPSLRSCPWIVVQYLGTVVAQLVSRSQKARQVSTNNWIGLPLVPIGTITSAAETKDADDLGACQNSTCKPPPPPSFVRYCSTGRDGSVSRTSNSPDAILPITY